jgi:hypothetical protein
VVYVGKAGKTLKERCDQHQAGFVSSTTGKKNARKLRKGMCEGKTYHLYSRLSASGTVLKEKWICMAAVEEIALIRKFNPPWNPLK